MFELTGFQRDLLYTTAGLTRPSGQDIKDHLMEITTHSDVNHGRLYPNLDALVEHGYLEKGTIDRRTNYYELSQKGASVIQDRRAWEDTLVDDTAQVESGG